MQIVQEQTTRCSWLLGCLGLGESSGDNRKYVKGARESAGRSWLKKIRSTAGRMAFIELDGMEAVGAISGAWPAWVLSEIVDDINRTPEISCEWKRPATEEVGNTLCRGFSVLFWRLGRGPQHGKLSFQLVAQWTCFCVIVSWHGSIVWGESAICNQTSRWKLPSGLSLPSREESLLSQR